MTNTTATATDGKTVHLVDAKQYEVIEYEDGTVSIRMPIGRFIDFSDLLDGITGALEADYTKHQTNLNYAMRKLISVSRNFCDENLAALNYFNELQTCLSRSTACILELHSVISEHSENKLSN